MSDFARLTKPDHQAIEYEVSIRAGAEPTLESLAAEGHRENRLMNTALDWIAGAGRVVTLLVAEAIQAGAALMIGTVFAVLEYWRVYHGASALGQDETQAALIAFAVVTANVVHPIYALRQLRGRNQLEITRMTGRGLVTVWLRRVFGRSSRESVDLYYNPTLQVAATVITWSTIILAVYDILGPLLTEVAAGALTRPLIIMLMELLVGLGLSVAGVFFLQSAAHEIGVRTLSDQPKRLTDLLEQRRAEYSGRVDEIRQEVRERYMTAKAAEQGRKTGEKVPFGSIPRIPEDPASTAVRGRENGHGGQNTAVGG